MLIVYMVMLIIINTSISPWLVDDHYHHVAGDITITSPSGTTMTSWHLVKAENRASAQGLRCAPRARGDHQPSMLENTGGFHQWGYPGTPKKINLNGSFPYKPMHFGRIRYN